MAKIKFDLSATNWTASCGRDHPIDDPLEVGVVSDESDGSQMYAYDKGADVQYFNLNFTKLNSADDTALRNFHANVCRGMLNTFTYTDEAGATHTVRWLDKRYPIRSNKENRYSGTISLREEIA